MVAARHPSDGRLATVFGAADVGNFVAEGAGGAGAGVELPELLQPATSKAMNPAVTPKIFGRVACRGVRRLHLTLGANR
jgi:hypothetical protein